MHLPRDITFREHTVLGIDRRTRRPNMCVVDSYVGCEGHGIVAPVSGPTVRLLSQPRVRCSAFT